MKTILHKSKGPDVLKLEELLISLGYNLPHTNDYFGADTDRAVRDFQQKNGLTVDGVVGPNTWNALISSQQVTSVKIDKSLTEQDYIDFAKEFDLELAIVKAVTEVESRGNGFLEDGRPIILFEGHIFWSQLSKVGIDPTTLANDRLKNVLYKTWTKSHYQGGTKEYLRLEKAAGISDDPRFHSAAYQSASWGLFQIMGFHYQNLNFATIDHFVSAMYTHEREHLKAFGKFISLTKISGNSLLDWLREKNWAKFAHGYNGAAYAQNNYDKKLETAYQKHRKP